MRKHLTRLIQIIRLTGNVNKMELKVHDRLAKHLLKTFGKEAPRVRSDIEIAIFKHNENYGLKNAA